MRWNKEVWLMAAFVVGYAVAAAWSRIAISPAALAESVLAYAVIREMWWSVEEKG